MKPDQVKVRVPASSANLGPGFDCLALAIGLWNEFEFRLAESGVQVDITGEGAESLPRDEHNLVVKTILGFFDKVGLPRPGGLVVRCHNEIPLGAGLGSSAATVLAGLLGANALAGSPVPSADLLHMAVELEGHPDNAAAALLGGLVVVIGQGDELLTHRFDLPALQAAVAIPLVDLPTRAMRAVLPKQVSLSDAVYNLGRTVLVVEALRQGDLNLLGQVMDDRLHQPYRLKLIPGAEAAIAAACQAGALAVGISGAGPGLIAFAPGDISAVAAAMGETLCKLNVPNRVLVVPVTPLGAQVT